MYIYHLYLFISHLQKLSLGDKLIPRVLTKFVKNLPDFEVWKIKANISQQTLELGKRNLIFTRKSLKFKCVGVSGFA